MMAFVAIFFAACQTPVEDSINELSLKGAKKDCTTIQSGELLTSSGDVITTGYNDFGYNYQAHIYNGDYGYEGWNLVMKWNDAWLSNMDCDGIVILDLIPILVQVHGVQITGLRRIQMTWERSVVMTNSLK